MTTIAFRNGIMAADSKLTTGGDNIQFLTTADKIHLLPSGALWGAAGDGDDRDLRDIVAKATPRRLPSRAALAEAQVAIDALLIFPSGPVLFVTTYRDGDEGVWEGQITRCREPFCAVGSGLTFALGAMAHGATAAEAVLIACKFDGASGPPVVEVPLPSPRRTRKRTIQ